MSPAVNRREQKLVLGGVPRAELLPPELKLEAAARAQRRVMVLLIVFVLVLAAGASFGASFLAQQSAADLERANQRTTEILLEQGKYSEVRQLAGRVSATEDARTLVMATDIAWSSQLSQLLSIATGFEAVLTNVSVTQGTAFAPSDAPANLLQRPRVATVSFTATTPTLVALSDWLDALSKLPGFADASFSSVTFGDGGYSTMVTLNLNETVYSNRFMPDTGEAETDGATDESTTGEETTE